MTITLGSKVEVEFLGKVRKGIVAREGKLDGGTIQTVFIKFDNDPLPERTFGFRKTQVKAI